MIEKRTVIVRVPTFSNTDKYYKEIKYTGDEIDYVGVIGVTVIRVNEQTKERRKILWPWHNIRYVSQAEGDDLF